MTRSLRIGIIRLSALGDCIVSGAFLANFVQHLQKTYAIELTWFIDSRFSGILENSPYIDSLEIISLKHQSLYQKLHLIQRLRKIPRFDILIDMQGLIKSALIGFFLKKKNFIGFSFKSTKESLSAMFYTHRIHIAYEENILQRNALLLQKAYALLHIPQIPSLSAMLTHTYKSFAYTSKALQTINTYLNTPPYILFVLESSIESKSYNPVHFSTLITFFAAHLQSAHIILLTHKQPHKATQILESLPYTHLTLTHLTNLSLDEVKALISRMDLVIGGDTGVTHLAWALQKDSITLYGNTPAQRFKLLGDNHIVLSGSDNPTYDKNDFSINNITPKQILDSALKLLGTTNKEALC